MRTTIHATRVRQAFTLLELLLAVAIFAVVLASINAVFYSAMRLQRTTQAAVDRSLPVNRASEVIDRDLRGIVLPGGILAGSFQYGVNTTNNTPQGSFEFTTSSGVVEETVPFGDLERVTYQLRASTDRRGGQGKELLRTMRRNILSTTLEEDDAEVLLANVLLMQVSFYNGTQWVETWDSTATTNFLPRGIRLDLTFTSGGDGAVQPPLRLTAPVMLAASTNQTQSVGGQN